MPRNATETRDRLLDAGQHLFADIGVYATPLSRIVVEAGQKNTSALQYHFASEHLDARTGLLFAIIQRHNDAIETTRARLLDVLDASKKKVGLRELVSAVITPQAHKLDDIDGREFLIIISQLDDLFDRWDSTATPAQALRAFRAIEATLSPSMSAQLRRERVTRFLEMVSEALGARSRLLNSKKRPRISNAAFLTNLTDMAVGALNAPSSVVD